MRNIHVSFENCHIMGKFVAKRIITCVNVSVRCGLKNCAGSKLY